MNNNKIYRLLRNNKEIGPLTAEEIISTGLKPFDLIWVDGRSAAWSYPGEINEFKLLVSTPGSEPEKRINRNNMAVSSTIQAAVAVNDKLAQPLITKQPKPRYKVSAAWSKIQTITNPVFKDVMIAEPKKASSTKKFIVFNPNNIQQTKSLSWEQAWKDWETEKTVAGIKQTEVVKPSLINKKIINEVAQTAPVLETKFKQSLDTLTDSYIDNLLKQKKRNKSFSFGKASEFVLPSIALIVIFSIGYWLMHNSKTSIVAPSSTPLQQQQKVMTQPNETSANLNTTSNNQNLTPVNVAQKDNSVLYKPSNSEVKEKSKIYQAANVVLPSKTSTEKIDNNNPISTTNSNTDLNKTPKPAAKQFDPSVINNVPTDKVYNNAATANNGDLNAAANRPVRRRTNASDVTNNASNNQSINNSSPTKNAESKNSAKYVSVPEYVQMNDGSGNVRIQNISDVDLDLVVIDVLYYDRSSQFKKGETLYLHNLKAGKTLTIKTPRDLNASYATAKVSMVSSDANGVYAIGDN